MITIILKGTTKNGEPFRREIGANLVGLTLFKNGLTSIDLSPLRQCPRLEALYIGDDEITAVDLSPLASCPELKFLRLSDTKLSSIDLSPLENCLKLQGLNLSNNRFTSIGSSPFCNSDSDNYSVDLAPLRKCQQLRQVNFENNPVTSLDLSFFMEFTNLQHLSISEDMQPAIVWADKELMLNQLPSGLKPYLKEIKSAWEEYTKETTETKD